MFFACECDDRSRTYLLASTITRNKSDSNENKRKKKVEEKFKVLFELAVTSWSTTVSDINFVGFLFIENILSSWLTMFLFVVVVRGVACSSRIHQDQSPR